jgi:hypothetical protein
VDATETLCHSAICQIGFFATTNDVPFETTPAAFFRNGGYTDRRTIVRFFRNSNSAMRLLGWNCNFFPQPDKND